MYSFNTSNKHAQITGSTSKAIRMIENQTFESSITNLTASKQRYQRLCGTNATDLQLD